MGKGYGEGPAAEERFEALARGDSAGLSSRESERLAVFGATKDQPEKHFIGWAEEVDADRLFASGKAWGLSVVRTTADLHSTKPRKKA